MVQVSDPPRNRKMLLSWRPSPELVYVGKWADRFKRWVAIEGGPITIFDIREAGMDKAVLSEKDADRATAREGRDNLTDFVSLLTMEYAEACSEEDDAHELWTWLPQLRSEYSPVAFWAVQLSPGTPREWKVGKHGEFPWREPLRWHFLPAKTNFVDFDAQKIDLHITNQCLPAIKTHPAGCALCHPHSQAEQSAKPPVATPGEPSAVLRALGRLFGRR